MSRRPATDVANALEVHHRATRRAVTYACISRFRELLSLQVERSAGADGPEHDELLFIVVHQVYELWFKSLHHELQASRSRSRTATPTGRCTR